MSMYGSLGSRAESLRDAFAIRLTSLTEVSMAYKRSVLRRQSRDTNRNRKKVGVLPVRIV